MRADPALGNDHRLRTQAARTSCVATWQAPYREPSSGTSTATRPASRAEAPGHARLERLVEGKLYCDHIFHPAAVAMLGWELMTRFPLVLCGPTAEILEERHYRVLHANEDPRAAELLECAYRELLTRANSLDNDDLRRVYLEDVPAHREIADLWNKAADSSLQRT